jgi:hypothetical protein
VRPALASKDLSLSQFREHLPLSGEIERKDCDIAMRYATPFSFRFLRTASGEARGVRSGSYCSRPQDSRNETPFRPLAEALDPYRAENRCALNSLDTDRSTTLSPETVTANVYLQHPMRISQAITPSHEKFSC